ncbi:MAG: hypothetical protein ACJ0QR_01380 [Flavobacteriales bacterium]
MQKRNKNIPLLYVGNLSHPTIWEASYVWQTIWPAKKVLFVDENPSFKDRNIKKNGPNKL